MPRPFLPKEYRGKSGRSAALFRHERPVARYADRPLGCLRDEITGRRSGQAQSGRGFNPNGHAMPDGHPPSGSWKEEISGHAAWDALESARRCAAEGRRTVRKAAENGDRQRTALGIDLISARGILRRVREHHPQDATGRQRGSSLAASPHPREARGPRAAGAHGSERTPRGH